MSGNVVSLNGEVVAPPAGESDPHLVLALEGWLEAARSGEVIGVAMAVQWRDGSLGLTWEGRGNNSMVGGLTRLSQRIARQLEADG